MDFERVDKVVTNQIRFILSIECEYENRSTTFANKLDNCRCIEEAEVVLLEHVKFTSKVLERMREYNKSMQEELKMSYAKFIGLATPYEKAIHVLRETKHQLDTYLKILREEMLKQLKHKMQTEKGYTTTPKKF